MKRGTLGQRLTVLAVVLIAGSLLAPVAAMAQGEDKWSFVLTPQVWVTHIAKNGFASPPNGSLQGVFRITDPFGTPLGDIFTADQSPDSTFNPQWGVQFAAQKGRLTLALGVQYVNFETLNDVSYTPSNNLPLCIVVACISPGERWAQESIDTTRVDVDLTASYFFPDVITGRLDASLGGGLKFIYASAKRQYPVLSAAAQELSSFESFPPPLPGGADGGLYTVCPSTCGDIASFGIVSSAQQVKQKSYVYGATIPMNTTLRLTSDSRWLLPFNVTPFIGAETRDSQNVAYSATFPPGLFAQLSSEDGTKFAYGVTADMTVRWLVSDVVSLYAGMRVQYINGFDTYLAYGPLVGMSARW